MTDAIPAHVALAVLASLSVDLRTSMVLAADGGVLAGDGSLRAPVAQLFQGSGPGGSRQAPHGDGGDRLFAARSPTHTVAVVAGPHAIGAVVVHDLLASLTDLGDC